MRLKFEKGMTPERMAKMFVEFIRQQDYVIGSVNMYIQTYDEDMNPVDFDKNDYFVCKPSKEAKTEYTNDVARIRRKRMKAV